MSVDHLMQLRTEGDLLVQAVGSVDLDRVVPGLDWDARTVALHTGAVHRWAADVVRRRLTSNETGGSKAFWPTGNLADGELQDWLGVGLTALLDVLTAAPEDLSCFTFVPGVTPQRFWRRRQAHETAVHRADVQAVGTGGITPFPADFAQDGLAELVGAFATEPAFASEHSGSLLLLADDGPAWRVVFGADRHVVASGSAAELGGAAEPGEAVELGEATVRGSSSDLYLWAWNRPAPVAVSGSPEAVETWRRVQVQ